MYSKYINVNNALSSYIIITIDPSTCGRGLDQIVDEFLVAAALILEQQSIPDLARVGLEAFGQQPDAPVVPAKNIIAYPW